MRIVVLGNGMLGTTVRDYFASLKKHEVVTFFAHEKESRFPSQIYKDFVLQFDQPGTVIINAAGAIPQRKEDMSINYELPEFLAANIKKAKVIHVSTDCVFSGNLPLPRMLVANNEKYAPLDSETPYGLSKIQGEAAILEANNPNFKTVRTSIIGIDQNKSGLLSWFLAREKGETVGGFAYHYWNGLTTLELAKQLESIIENWEGDKLIQIASQYVYSKYELLRLFAANFKRYDIKIFFNGNGYCNRGLVSDYQIKDIDEQLFDFRKFYNL